MSKRWWLLVVVLLAGAVVYVVTRPRIVPRDATTAAPVTPAPVPDMPTAERWQWSSREPVRSVTPAGAGVVVHTTTRLVALDGVTGAERWHYATPGGGADQLTTSRDGRVVVAYLGDGYEAHAFDAITGQVLWHARVAATAWATDRTLVTYDQNGYVGRDIRTGTTLWQAVDLLDCGGSTVSVATTGDLVLGSGRCRTEDYRIQHVVTARDASTGRVLWRYAATPGENRFDLGVVLSRWAGIRTTTADYVVVDDYEPSEGEFRPSTVVLDRRTGAKVSAVAWFAGYPLAGRTRNLVVADREDGTGLYELPGWRRIGAVGAGRQTSRAWLGATVAITDPDRCPAKEAHVKLVDLATGGLVGTLAGCGSLYAAPGALVASHAAGDGRVLLGFR